MVEPRRDLTEGAMVTSVHPLFGIDHYVEEHISFAAQSGKVHCFNQRPHSGTDLIGNVRNLARPQRAIEPRRFDYSADDSGPRGEGAMGTGRPRLPLGVPVLHQRPASGQDFGAHGEKNGDGERASEGFIFGALLRQVELDGQGAPALVWGKRQAIRYNEDCDVVRAFDRFIGSAKALLSRGRTYKRFKRRAATAVSRMIDAGVPLPKIAKMVGWSPSTIVRLAARCGHFSLEELRSAVETIRKGEIEVESPVNSPVNSPVSTEQLGSKKSNLLQ
jgi:hypothetical protein